MTNLIIPEDKRVLFATLPAKWFFVYEKALFQKAHGNFGAEGFNAWDCSRGRGIVFQEHAAVIPVANIKVD